MMKIPIIGVMLAQVTAPLPGASRKIQYVNSAYFKAVERAGGLPLGLPLTQSPEQLAALLALCDGFLLPGGEDVDPRVYGEAPHPALGTVSLEADMAWSTVVHYAQEHGRPLLGICRGLQLANTALGGSLYQDLALRPGASLLHMQRQDRDYPLHEVTIEPDSSLARLLETTKVYTNSLHHQCVKEAGQGLRITARTEDGVPEAMETNDGMIVLVQWHPEELQETVPCMRNLFLNLVRCAAACQTEK